MGREMKSKNLITKYDRGGNYLRKNASKKSTFIEAEARDRFEESGRRQSSGFTLIELIVVMAVIGILVLLAAPKFLGYTERARETKYIHTAKVVETALEAYLINGGVFPNDLEVVDETLLEEAATNMSLIGINGYVSNVEDVYYELTYDFIHKLDVKIYASNELFVEAIASDQSSAIYASAYGIALINKDKPMKGLPYPPIEEDGDIETPDDGYVFTDCKIDVTDTSHFNYTISNNTAIITGFSETGVGLDNINIPAEINGYPVVAVGGLSFDNEGLKSICIPDSLTSIGQNAFSNNLIESIDLKNVTSISSGAFSGNLLLKHVKINTNLTNTYSSTAKNQPFYGLELGSGLVFGEEVTEIPQAFFRNSGITHIKLNNVAIVKPYAFQGNKIKTLIIDNPVEIGNLAFAQNLIKSVDLTKVSQIGQYSFNYNEISTVELGSIDNIPIGAFANNKLTEINLENVTTIGTEAFMNNNLSFLDLKNVINLNNGAFKNNNISQLVMSHPVSNEYQYAGTGPFEGNQLGDGINLSDDIIKIPRGLFRNAGVTSIDLNKVTVVGLAAFQDNMIKTLNLKNVQRVEKSAFQGNLIDDLDLSNVSIIDGYAFSNNLLKNVDFKNVTTVGSHAFTRNNLVSINLKNVTNLGNNAFRYNPNLKHVWIHKDIANNYSIQTNPFYENNLLDGVVLGDEVTRIPDYMFYQSGLTHLNLNKVTSIGSWSFYNNNISSLFIPRSVASIKVRAFSNNFIANVQIDNIEGALTIGSAAFDNNGVDGRTSIAPNYLLN